MSASFFSGEMRLFPNHQVLLMHLIWDLLKPIDCPWSDVPIDLYKANTEDHFLAHNRQTEILSLAPHLKLPTLLLRKKGQSILIFKASKLACISFLLVNSSLFINNANKRVHKITEGRVNKILVNKLCVDSFKHHLQKVSMLIKISLAY